MADEIRTVTKRNTGGPTHKDWVNATFAEYALQLDVRGLALEIALPVARWITCLHWLETGEGDSEWNFNAGNVHCGGTIDPRTKAGWHGDCVQAGSERIRAYATRKDAVADFLDLMEGRSYHASWHWLLEHPEDGAGWYARLQADGYSARSQAGIDLLLRLAASFTRVRGG